MKVTEFQVLFGSRSDPLSLCREVTYKLSSVDAAGRIVVQEREALVYEGLLADGDQLAWVVGEALQAMMRSD